MLTNIERVNVEQELALALASEINPRNYVNVILLGQAAPIDIPPSAGNAEIAAFVVSACLESRWTQTPALLDLLLDRLITGRGIGALQPILDRVRQQIDPNPNVYDSAWLIGDRPFFDRRELRTRVARLIESNGRPILRVWAGPGSFGRTYTRYFFEHLEDRSPGTVHVIPAELSEGTGPSYQVSDLLETIAGHLGVQQRIPARTSSSYPTTAARWILRQLMSRPPAKWLIVLDGFGQKELFAEVRDTINELAWMIPSGQYRSRIRLILLDYAYELHKVSPADFLEENLQPAHAVALEDLTPVLTAWNAERTRQGRQGMIPGELDKLAIGMLQQAPTEGKVRLQALNDSLSKLYTFQ